MSTIPIPRRPLRRLAASLMLVFASGLVLGCLEHDETNRIVAQPTVEVEGAENMADYAGGFAQGAELAKEQELDVESRLVRAPDDTPAEPERKARARMPGSQPQPAPPAPSKSLSELEYQTAQSRNQRANEAFDYLGPQAFEAQPGKDVPDPAARHSQLHANLAGAGERLDEAVSLRDADALRKREESAARGLVSQNELRALGYAGGRQDGWDLKQLAASEPPAFSAAQAFERMRRSLEGVPFQSASGYWANTYVPGDPVMRWLEARLGERDLELLQAWSPQPLLLEAGSRQPPQPFDAPDNAALSVFMQADRRGLEGEGRMLVQVGLQGAHRRSGLRPAMSVGVVLDLRGSVSTEHIASMRALMDGFLTARDVGDRFSLTVAGRPGATLVNADDFRHGPITVAMSQILEPGAPGLPKRETLSLEEAVGQTTAELQRGDDPSAPLGSSMLLLVTNQPFGSSTQTLVSLAHQSAVAGVPVSVVGIGEGVSLAEIERVALAGQGNRRLMHSAADAESLVARELSALARVIARAVRLRIRLAPGVKLVEVVGAERLDAAGAQNVRNAEKSIDRRLSRNLGIESDRGEDEAGIQIVIPTFQSSDSHAVLLDVVASGPGPIADVTVRYKDLVYLRNNVARTNLTLGHTASAPGPLERNVVKNFLAIRLADTLKQAGRMLLAGSDPQAIAQVREFQGLLASLQREVPGFQHDADLGNDAHMLGEYLALLETGAVQQAEPRQYLADSLQLSGYFKTIPRSTSDAWSRRR